MSAPVYEIASLLGEGGIGSVYRAVHHPSGLGVAVKTLRRSMADARSRRLLLREAAAVGGLDHPNIVRLIDLTHDADGRPALVMELVEGMDFRRALECWPGFAPLARTLLDGLEGLATAHGAGIVHRDLKPENLLVDAHGRGMLTDFGVAEVLDPLAAAPEARRPAGTPEYMAPEQLDPHADIGPWTDLYAVGIMLHELIFDAPLFDATTLRELMAEKRRTHSLDYACRRGLEVPDALVQLVRALVDPEPSRRPRFARDVIDALAAALPHVREAESTGSANRAGSVATAQTLAVTDAALAETMGSLEARAPASTRVTSAVDTILPAAPSPGSSVDVVRLRRPALVGRAEERRTLWAAVERVCSDHTPEVVMLVGPAGVGKSALARWGLSEVERRGMMEGTAAAYDLFGGDAQGGLRQATRRLARSGASVPDNDVPFPWLHRAGAEGGPAVDEGELATWLTEDGARQLSTAHAVQLSGSVIQRVSRACPVYLWLDDPGWSRDGALELAQALSADAGAAVLIVMTFRTGTTLHDSVRDALGPLEAAATRMNVGALDAEARRALLSATVGVAEGTAEALASELPGSPLELLTVVRGWVEEEDLVPGADGYELAPGRAPADLFTDRSLGDALRARIAAFLDGFGDARGEAQEVLLVTALIGVSFEERIASRANASSELDAALVLDRAVLHGLLVPERDRRRLRFEHGLVQEALIDLARTHPSSRRLHRAAADGITAFYDASHTAAAERAAELYVAAGDVERGAELMLAGAAARLRIGEREISRGQTERVGRWLDEADVPRDHALRAQLLYVDAERLYYGFEYAESEARLAEAMRIFQAADDVPGMTRSRLLLSGLHFYQNRFSEAADVVQSVLDSEREIDLVNLGFAHHRMMQIQLLSGRVEEAYASGSRSIEYSRAAKNWARHRLGHLALVESEVCLGRTVRARIRLDAAHASAVREADAVALSYVADLEIFLSVVEGRPEDVRDACRRLSEQSDEKGDHWRATFYLAFVLLIEGRSASEEELSALVERFVAWFSEAPNDEPPTRWALHHSREILRERGGVAADRFASVVDKRERELRAGLRQGFALWDPSTLVPRA